MYRPKRFKEVMGQEIPVTLLLNALRKNKLPKCVIFYGSSGIGKTTLARLVAAWQVCTNLSHDDVCGKCQMCLSVQNGSIVDVMEFDAASHTSIEDIREILELCNYAPQIAKEKVFIIDEAHMLSRNAIAGLLKTFEENIEHVRFILATTEIEKISSAIRSRCFCIPLKEMKMESVVQYVKEIAQSEDIEIDESSLQIIYDLSYGSMREALSIFNRAKMLSEKIDQAVMEKIVSFVSQETLKKIVKCLVGAEFVALYELLVDLIEKQGVSSVALLKQILAYFRKHISQLDLKMKEKILKIMIDLNNLQHQLLKLAFFNEAIIIGLVNISYLQKNS